MPADAGATTPSAVTTPADVGATAPSAVATPADVAAIAPSEVAAPLKPATLQIAATDAPPEGVTKILITVSNIEVQKAGGDTWTVVVSGTVDFDLVEIQGIETTLGEAILEPGTYNQIRLSIESAEVTVQGVTLNARVPSGRLKIVGGFTLDAGATTIVTLDFDAAKSVVIAGKRNVLIKPVIKMLSRRGDQPMSEADEIGSIEEGAVTEPGDAPDTSATAGSKSTLSVADHDELGAIIVDGEGFTLYLFADDEPNVSNCGSGCASSWPPLLVSEVDLKPVGEGVQPDLLSSTERADGDTQVTYDGPPLYNYSGDRSPGDTRGHGVGQVWFATTPSGERATAE